MADEEKEQGAREIDPRYTVGEPVKVARAANQPEAELIEGLLREAGIPSLQLRARGADVPDFLAAGPRDIFVPESAAEVAREALAPRSEATEGE
jgi:hypothetical protein